MAGNCAHRWGSVFLYTCPEHAVLVMMHLVFHRLTVVQVSFCSLIKGITPNIRTLCFVLINKRSFEPCMCLDRHRAG